MSRPSLGAEAQSSGLEDITEPVADTTTPLFSGTTQNSTIDDMVAASKELPKNEAPCTASAKCDDSVFGLVYSIAKKVSMVGAIYLVGYMNWSVAWLITPVILAVTREYWRKTSDMRREIAKASAVANEKDVILARINDLPAWVYFPDIERCEWINRILQQIWPNANYYAKDLVRDVIEPKVAEALSEYKLNGFKFDRMNLGTIPPRIGGVKVYDKNISRNEIILDMDLFYASDCDITFQLAGMKAGIKDFQIHGMLRVIMKPLITKIPLVGGLQIFFLNNPDVDFNLVGVADLLDMPGLSDMLRRIIVEQIGAIMVLPNKLPITLNNEVPSIALKMPEPEGVLRVHVVEAKDLMKKDIGVLGKGKSDPYAIVTVGSQQFRTQTIDSNVNPKWDYWCEAIIQAEVGQYVQITLFDKDEASDDEPLGRATVEISNVVKNGALDTWITLEAAKHGMIHVRFTWLELSSLASDLFAALKETQLLRVTNMSSAILSVYLDSATDLPQARAQSKPDPYAVLSVGKQSNQTGAVRRSDLPVWETGFSFLVSNPENDTLQLRIVDQKTDKELGQFTYVLSALLAKPDLQIVSQPFQLQKSGATSKVTLSMALKILRRSIVTEAGAEQPQTPLIQRQETQKEFPVQSLPKVKLADMPKSNSTVSSSIKELIKEEADAVVAAKPTIPDATAVAAAVEDKIISETMNLVSAPPANASHGLGQIQLSLQYVIQRQRLLITVHKISNIPLKDPSNIPDPYVKLYLLPGRAKDSKRKTITIKDNCNPVYEASFEYLISQAELNSSELEVTVATQKGFFIGGSPVIGMIKLNLNNPSIVSDGISQSYDLQPESNFD